VLPTLRIGLVYSGLQFLSSTRAVSKTPKFAHFTPVLKSLHWFQIEQCIQYKVASITYKVLQSSLNNLLNVQYNSTTCSSDIITLQRPSVRSRLKVTDRSFTHYAPVLWNSLPKQLRQPSAPPSLSTSILILLLYLPCQRISFTFKSKRFSLNNPFILGLVCTEQLLSVLWLLDLANGFHLMIISTPSFIFTSFMYANDCE